jgi:hypothetical protein
MTTLQTFGRTDALVVARADETSISLLTGEGGLILDRREDDTVRVLVLDTKGHTGVTLSLGALRDALATLESL